MPHRHDWIDVTTFGDQRKRLVCNCGSQAWQTFGPVNVSTREDEAELVTVLLYNDGSNRVEHVPVPMTVRTLEPIEIV
jgi:hypothetical protein